MKKNKKKKITKSEIEAKRISLEYSHCSTDAIQTRRSLLLYQCELIEGEIDAYSRKVTDLRKKRTSVQAEVDGLSRVVEKR